MPHKGALLAIIYHDQVKAFADKIGQFLRIKLLCHLSKQTDHFIVTVDPRFSFILSLFHMLADHADHPDNSHQMIDVLVSHKNLPHILPGKTCLLQLTKQSVSTAAVDQKMFFSILQYKAGVVAFRHHCISRSEHCYIHGYSSCVYCVVVSRQKPPL